MTNEIAVIKRDNITVYNEAKEIITKIEFTLIGISPQQKKKVMNTLCSKKLWSSQKGT